MRDYPVASKKQIILPIAVLVGGLGMAFAFASMKQPPVEKPEQDLRPLVSIKPLSFDAITLDVKSYGLVKPKNETFFHKLNNSKINLKTKLNLLRK